MTASDSGAGRRTKHRRSSEVRDQTSTRRSSRRAARPCRARGQPRRTMPTQQRARPRGPDVCDAAHRSWTVHAGFERAFERSHARPVRRTATGPGRSCDQLAELAVQREALGAEFEHGTEHDERPRARHRRDPSADRPWPAAPNAPSPGSCCRCRRADVTPPARLRFEAECAADGRAERLAARPPRERRDGAPRAITASAL